mmetsp:Transcript_7205/g.15667  ORF Transcript_7205/g.15667 Transcript_7205/m.15667 type:complete len:201 (+) Transcript_7205:821-1423(+)
MVRVAARKTDYSRGGVPDKSAGRRRGYPPPDPVAILPWESAAAGRTVVAALVGVAAAIERDAPAGPIDLTADALPVARALRSRRGPNPVSIPRSERYAERRSTAALDAVAAVDEVAAESAIDPKDGPLLARQRKTDSRRDASRKPVGPRCRFPPPDGAATPRCYPPARRTLAPPAAAAVAPAMSADRIDSANCPVAILVP